MIGALVVALLAIAALAWVAVPIRRRPQPLDNRAAELAEAEARKRDALGALADLEDDLEMGKLSESDFLTLRADHEADALIALRELDLVTTARNDPMEKELEEEIAAARERVACPSCGGPRRPDQPCPRCGA